MACSTPPLIAPGAIILGADAYEGLDLKAAVPLESIVGNHPLVDGNKRLGWLAVVVFFGLNGADLNAPDDDAVDLVMAIAGGLADVALVARHLARWH